MSGKRPSRRGSFGGFAATALIAAIALLALAAPAQGTSGTFDRTWGEDVDSLAPGIGFEVCTAAASCKTGVTTIPALGGDMNFPLGVATDAAGNIYVADLGHHRIQKFNSSGAFERAWGEDVINGGGTGFEVCVVANGDICKTGVNTVPALGGEMFNPASVATDTAGNVYVADSQHSRIQKFNSSGAFERAWGEDVVLSGEHETAGDGFEICVSPAGSTPDDVCKTGINPDPGPALGGEMASPTGVGTDAAANVYVADTSNNRVQKFNSSGAFERAWGEDVASAGPGNTGVGFEVCVAATGDTCKIGIFTPPALGGEMQGPQGVATDAASNVYVADTSNHRVQKFNSSGAFERAWGEDVASAGPGNTGSGFEVCVAARIDHCKTGITDAPARGGEMNNPVGVATDAAGNVYVGEFNHHRVQKFNSSGAFERAWGEDVDLIAPGTDFEICTVAANCIAGDTTGVAFGGEMRNAAGVATDAAGNLYVADALNNRIQKFADPVASPPVVSPPVVPPALVTPPATATGQRAAALKKCKKKRGRARTNCKKRANKLPV